MTTRIVLAGAVAAALAVPGSASAAGTVTGGPAKAGGYQIYVHGVDARRDTLHLTMERGSAKRGESETLSVTRGVRIVVRGGSASIKGSLGARGTVDLELRGARRESRGTSNRRRCTSTATTYTGRLAGRLRLKLPSGRWATIRSLPAQAYGKGEVTCKDLGPDLPAGDGDGGDGDGSSGEPQLMLTKDAGDGRMMFLAERKRLSLTQMGPERRERGATVQATRTAHASGSNLLRVAGGGASATVRSAGAFTGTGLFNATSGAGPYATGPLTGNLRVKLGGMPVIDIAGDDAILLNGDKG